MPADPGTSGITHFLEWVGISGLIAALGALLHGVRKATKLEGKIDAAHSKSERALAESKEATTKADASKEIAQATLHAFREAATCFSTSDDIRRLETKIEQAMIAMEDRTSSRYETLRGELRDTHRNLTSRIDNLLTARNNGRRRYDPSNPD